jgi:O-antigen/teichoic acid export membrane protein
VTTEVRHPPRFTPAALYTYGTQIAAAALSLLNVLIVSRALGPAGRGDVAFLMTVPQLSANLVLFGVQEANANFAAGEPKLRRALATNSIILSAVLGFLCVAFLVVLIEAVPAVGGHVDHALLWFALSSIPILVLQTYLQFLITADYRFRVANNAYMITPLLNVAINGALAATGVLTVGLAFASWFIGQFLATAFFVWYVGDRIAGYGRPDRKLGRRALNFGFKSYLGRTMMFGNYRLDQWLMGSMTSASELGLYSIAVACTETLFFLPTALVQVQRPYLVRSSQAEAGRRAALIFRVGVLITLVLAAGLFAFADIITRYVFGPEFADAGSQIRILTLGAFGIVALKQFSNALTAQRRPGLGSIAVSASLVASIVLDVVLIPSHGGIGASIASTVSYSLGGVVIAVMFVRVFKLKLRSLVPTPHDVALVAREA